MDLRSAGRFDELDVTQAMKFHHFFKLSCVELNNQLGWLV
ncbi:hypothetical protein CK203_097159 [Vitis vinifera]|uniref:Uncharacterized protein n=1 Tax=Vitis vinifera TaxID=29760 RepID=A0A438EUN9_VITVI|nr:hypothetical protein CK203_097159 [Vitis vinifera]